MASIGPSTGNAPVYEDKEKGISIINISGTRSYRVFKSGNPAIGETYHRFPSEKESEDFFRNLVRKFIEKSSSVATSTGFETSRFAVGSQGKESRSFEKSSSSSDLEKPKPLTGESKKGSKKTQSAARPSFEKKKDIKPGGGRHDGQKFGR